MNVCLFEQTAIFWQSFSPRKEKIKQEARESKGQIRFL